MAKKEDTPMTREDRIAQICKTINAGDFGGENKDALVWLGSRDVKRLERFSSGDNELDYALGGGWPRGRFIEVYGPESGGKTTLCLHAIAEFQRKYPDEEVAVIDTEYSFDEEYAAAVGVNTKYLIFHQPDDGIQALNVLEQLIKLGIGCIVVDSVAALTTKADMEGTLGDVQVAEQARLMSGALRKLTTEAGKRNTTVLWTNQMRDKIGVTYGDKTTTPAGRALRFYASVRCAIRRVSTQKEMVNGEEVAIANETQVDVKKNKTAPPFRTAKFYIVYGRGIDPVISVFDAALKYKVIDKRGSWFSFNNEQLGQGRAAVIDVLHNDEEWFAKIREQVEEVAKNKTPITEPKTAGKVIKKPTVRGGSSASDVEVTDV